MTLIAIGIYWIPVTHEVSGDFQGSAYKSNAMGVDRITIEGRNNARFFETIVRNVPMVSIERSNDPGQGRWKIRFRSNLHNRLKLNRYEILRFRNVEQ